MSLNPLGYSWETTSLSTRYLPDPLPESVEQALFWLTLLGEVIIIGAEIYVAWTHGWIKLSW
jgi:hypothetical protein